MFRVLLRDALRSLRHDVRFVVVAVALLALTIGTATAMYAMVHALVLRPFPFADQDRLLVIWQRDDRRALPVVEVAHGEMVDWRARTRSFDDLAVVGSVNWSVTLVGRSAPEAVPMSAVSASFFPVVGAWPVHGRAFGTADEDGALPRVMVISHGLWLRRYGGDPSIVGRAVPVEFDAAKTAPVEIVGVMPRDFDFPRGTGAWRPAAPLIRKDGDTFGGVESSMRWLRVFFVLGRLKEGVSVESATRELTHVMRTAKTEKAPEANQALVLTPIAAYLLGPAGPVLWTLLAGAVLMLTIACANVAGLQVSRAARRQRTGAIRAALGASARHLFSQVVLESGLVTMTALASAVGVAYFAIRGLLLLAPAEVPRLDTVTLFAWPVLAAGTIVTFATVLVTGLWPALAARRVEAVSLLAHGAGAAADPRGRRVQGSIVVAQVAVGLTLLAGTGLFVRTLHKLDRTTLGFEPDRLLALSIAPPTKDPARWNAYYDQLIRRVERLPGVTAAAAVQLRPLSGPVGWESQPIFPGQVPEDPATWGLNPHMNLQTVTPGYFRAMEIRLVRGRVFTDADTANAPGAVIVSESTARRLWPGRDALGQRMAHYSYVGSSEPAPRMQTVVGVVEDVRYRGLNDVRLDCYMPAKQSRNTLQQLMVRSSGNPAGVVASVRAAAREIDSAAAVSEAVVMSAVVAAESAPWRFLQRLFVAFAAMAGLLAAIGLAGVITLAVAIRRRELAIRAALGADRARLRALVLGEGLLLVGGGVGLGVLFALALGRAVAHVLVGVTPHDPPALIAAACLSALTGLVASWIPARRAADADPIEALRAE